MPETVLLLHGFAGTGRAWDAVVEQLTAEGYRPLAPDLPGHGRSGAVRPVSLPACVRHVLAQSPARFTLCGYSLGGRIALALALSAPERVRRLVLVSSTAGIEDPVERAARARSDHRLADELERGPFEDFIAAWRGQELFAGEPAAAGELARADMRRNSPGALAAVLRGAGAGEMEPMWDRLGELRMPVDILVGERDRKYRALGERMAGLVGAGRLRVLAGGHALGHENPRALAAVLREGLDAEAG